MSLVDVGADVERIWLDERSWVDVARGWLPDADAVYESVVADAPWHQSRIFRYERWVDEPRLSTSSKVAGMVHPALGEAHRAIRHRYKPFDGFALAWYRDGRDGVAFHRDRELRWLDDTVIAVLTLGAQRPWLMRPRSNRYSTDENGGATLDLAPASGDLLVMGGRCQADWEHSVPKLSRPVRGRVSLQWRWTSRTGRPERGANYLAPRTYSR